MENETEETILDREELGPEAGFARVEVQQIEGDLFNNYFVARRS